MSTPSPTLPDAAIPAVRICREHLLECEGYGDRVICPHRGGHLVPEGEWRVAQVLPPAPGSVAFRLRLQKATGEALVAEAAAAAIEKAGGVRAKAVRMLRSAAERDLDLRDALLDPLLDSAVTVAINRAMAAGQGAGR